MEVRDLFNYTNVLHTFYQEYLLSQCKLFKVTKENLNRVSTHLKSVQVTAVEDGSSVCTIEITHRLGGQEYTEVYCLAQDMLVYNYCGEPVNNSKFLKSVKDLVYTLSDMSPRFHSLLLIHPLYRNDHGTVKLTLDNGDVYMDYVDKRGIPKTSQKV